VQAPPTPKENSPKKQSLGKKNFLKNWAANGYLGQSENSGQPIK
jgi:hypothetical protein